MQKQIVFTEKLINVRIQESDHCYLNELQPQAFHPSENPQRTAPTISATPQIQEYRKEQEIDIAENLLTQLLDAVSKIDQRREQTLQEMQQVAIELAVAAASHLVHTVIEEDKFGIEDVIQTTFAQAGHESSLQFELHPDDLELLDRRLAVTTAYSEIRELDITTNNNLKRGSFQVKLADGQTWLTGISLRLAEIRKHWLEELDAAQVERRQAQKNNSSLRRFPDRRETA